MKRYICIHGHFYQPPRENPWLETIEFQESAYPYHDWNERITSECYMPNATSRILDSFKNIIEIVNNYAAISFNFGPTLLSWLESHAGDDYQNILKADRESQKIFSGHGSALAQVYNHMIMPLANTKDKRTQIIWGIRDFEVRFRRQPEGMWLSETAVDIETLEILAEMGIQFTILAPHQAKRIRKLGEEEWDDLRSAGIDPKVPYLCPLPSGRKISIFFYDGVIASEVAFRDLLKDGRNLADRLLSVFSAHSDTPQLVHIATDGETYGHHHRFADMALAFCINYLQENNLAQVTIYAQYLKEFPPEYEVEINENTSWSCSHGVERWQSDCGCRLGLQPLWKQKWRAPLRQALNWLRDETIPLYEEHMKAFTPEPWLLRDRYVDVILDRSVESVERFFKENMQSLLSQDEKVKALKLLELERHAMLMYTSCGWFFDEISGIETIQILQYAARVIQLSQELFNKDFEPYFLSILEKAPSNKEELKNGALVYQKLVKPAVFDLLKVGAHYGISLLFEEPAQEKNFYCYSVKNKLSDRQEADGHTLVSGLSSIRSVITWEETQINYAFVFSRDQCLYGNIRLLNEKNDYLKIQQKIKNAFLKRDLPFVIQLIHDYFGVNDYSLESLFKDEQRVIFNKVLNSAQNDLDLHSRQIYKQIDFFLRSQEELKIVPPKVLNALAEFIFNRDILAALSQEKINIPELERLSLEAKRFPFEIDKTPVSSLAAAKINQLMEVWRQDPQDRALLELLTALLRILNALPLDLDIYRAQTVYFMISKERLREMDNKPSDPALKKHWELFRQLGRYLKVSSQGLSYVAPLQ